MANTIDSNKEGLSHQLPLGKQSDYIDTYTPELLCAIPRQLSRDNLKISQGNLPFIGEDMWNAYELSWLNASGRPEVAVAQFYFPCDSESIIESKSFKLYLNSFNQTRFKHIDQMIDTLKTDLTNVVRAPVNIRVLQPPQWAGEKFNALSGQSLDELDITIEQYQPEPKILILDNQRNTQTNEQLYSHLFRSLCPVTGQPDWGSIHISYSGAAISHQAILTYLIGYRQHQDFHEQCVERIFMDIMTQCKPDELAVCAYFLRRGGLDINPCRLTHNHNTLQQETFLSASRLLRQ